MFRQTVNYIHPIQPALAAIVIVVFLLRDNPTVLVNILYIVGIIIVLWILKGPHEKNPFKKE